MKDYGDAQFYAISGIGYGKGFTAEEAEENYYAQQARSFRHLHRTVKGRIAKIKEMAPPSIFKAPADATGFVFDGSVRWTVTEADGSTRMEAATEEQVVKLAR